MPKIITLLLLIMVAQQTAPPRPTLIVTQPGVSFNTTQWNADGSRLLTTTDLGRCMLTEYPPQGQTVETFCPELETQAAHTVRVWDMNAQSRTFGEVLLELDFADSAGSLALWNRQETRIMAYSMFGGAYVWDAETGVEQYHIRPDNLTRFIGARWSADGEQLLVMWADGDPNSALPLHVEIWQDGQAIQAWRIPLGPFVWAAGWSADGQRILASNLAEVYVWDVSSGEELHKLDLTPVEGKSLAAHRFTWDADLAHLWLVDETAGEVQQWDLAETRLTRVSHAQVEGVRLNQDESRIVTWSNEVVHVWDALTLDHQAEWQYRGNPLLYIFSASWMATPGQLIIYADKDLIWEPDSGREEIFACPDTECSYPLWNAQETQYAIGTYIPENSDFSGVRIYDSASGALRYDLSRYVMRFASAKHGAVYSWSPEGHLLLIRPVFGSSLLVWEFPS